jgi:hypothetical protein
MLKQSFSSIRIIACLVFFCTAITGYAQMNTYVFSQSVQPFSQASRGVILGTESNAGLRSFLDPALLAGSATATTGPGFPIGFNFVYRGVTYDRFGVMNSGWICLGRSQYGNHAVDIGQLEYQPLEKFGPASDTLRARIVGFDANLVGNGTSASLAYDVIGDSTDLTLIIKWKNYKLFQSSGTNFSNVNFEIRLKALDHSIDIQYGDMSVLGYTSTSLCNVGLGGFYLGDFSNRKTPLNRNWNQTTTGVLHTDDCVMQSSSIPPEFGLNFHWDPAACPPIPQLQYVYVTQDSCSLVWPAPVNIVDPEFEYALTTSSVPPGGGTITQDTTFMMSGLSPGTSYYFHIRIKCNPGTSSAWRTYPVVTLCNVFSFPFFQDFDTTAVPNLPACISRFNNHPNTKTWVTDDESGASQPVGLIIPYDGNFINDDWLFLPGLALEQDSTYIISMDYGSDGKTLKIYTGQYPDKDSMQLVDTIVNLSESSEYQQKTIFYTPDTAGVYYFSLRSAYADIRVDNIYIDYYQCTPPDSLVVLTNELNHVVLKWNATNMLTDSFQYSLSTSGFYPPSSPSFTDEDSLVFTNLESGKPYHFFLRSVCGEDRFSPWQSISFETKSAFDECLSAIEIIPSPTADCDTETFSTHGATDSGVPTTLCPGIPDDDVWFKFTATERSHTIYFVNFCFGAGTGSLTGRSVMTDVCQPMIVELRGLTCGDSIYSCIEVLPGLTSTLNQPGLEIDSTYYIRVYPKDTVAAGQTFRICVGSFPIETNNTCQSAFLVPVSTTSCPTAPVKNIGGADPATMPESSCAEAPFFDLWYKFVTTATTHSVEASFGQNGDGVVDVFDGTCASLTLLACSDSTTFGSEQLTLSGLTIGDTLFIRVYDAPGLGMPMNVTVCVKIPIANDLCENAIQIDSVNGITLAHPANANSFSSTGAGTCNGFYADDDLWYKFTALQDTHLLVVIPISPSPMVSPVLEIFEGNCSSNSMACSNTGELLVTTLTPGQEYYIRVYSAANGSGRGNFRIGITVPPPNIYCSNAINIPVNENQDCQFTTPVHMTGAGVKNEVWYSFVASNSNIAIETSDTTGMTISLYDGCGGTFINNLKYAKNLILGHTYLIRIWTVVLSTFNYQYFQEDFSICILTSPEHDECTTPISFTPVLDQEVSIVGNTKGATPSITGGSCNANKYDVWYRFTALAPVHKLLLIGGPDFGVVSSGQVFKGNCPGEPLLCFSSPVGSGGGIAVLKDLEVDSHYLVSINSGDVINPYPWGEFTLKVTNPPDNDHCLYATPVIPSYTNECVGGIPGTLINATESLGRINVWYTFTAQTNTMTMVIRPTSAGLDPAIKVWNPTTGGHLENGVFDIVTTFDDTHADFQPEVLSLNNLTIGNTYLIEVYPGELSDTTGTFEFCLFDPDDKMIVHSSSYSTYPYDTVVSAGTWNQPVVRVTLNMSGINFNKTIRQLRFNLSGTTELSDILSARVFVDTKVWTFNNSADLPFRPFGRPGDDPLAEYPPPALFGEIIENPDSVLVFNGEFLLIGEKYGPSNSTANNYERFIYLVLEIACDVETNHIIHGICESITLDNEEYIPLSLDVYPLPIIPLDSYDTRANGSWTSGASWVCGQPPPDNPGNAKTNIYHQIRLQDTTQIGSLSIYYQRSLTINDQGYLMLGASSQDTNSGFSNCLLDCSEGSLKLEDAKLEINGGFNFGTAGGEMDGNGLCCNYGQGYYHVLVNDSIIREGGNFLSVDHFSFCVADGQYVEEGQPFQSDQPVLKVPDKSTAEPLKLFTRNNNRHSITISDQLKAFELLTVDTVQWKSLRHAPQQYLSFSIPLDQRKSIVLELERTDQFIQHTVVRTAPDMSEVPVQQAVHYRGHIQGDMQSMVTLSIFEDEIVGMISSQETSNLTLGKVKGTNAYILYHDIHLEQYFRFTCGTPDDGKPYGQEEIKYKASNRSAGDCIQVYIEIDNDITEDKGGLGPAVNYVTALYNQVVALYAEEDINLVISELLVWTEQSVYTQGDMIQILEKFKEMRPSFTGDLGILLSYKFAGGLSQLDGLCRSNQQLSLCYAGIYPSFSNIPVYSWSVEVMAHELGHSLGSRHTHACVWNGDQTAIDGCYTTEGNCEPLIELPPQGGTVMSYCHLTEVGINFSEGFGEQPGNVMRYAVDHATCTQSCPGDTCLENQVTIKIRIDNLPYETTWTIADSTGNIVQQGGPYVQDNFIYTKIVCLPDGCYEFTMIDTDNGKPGGTFIGIDSEIIIDGNDGINAPESNYFRLQTSNIYTENMNIRILDPAQFLYNGANQFNLDWNGIVTTGGGDDTLGSTGFSIHTSGTGNGLMIIDSLIVDGGYASEKRHTKSAGNFTSCRDAWIKPDAELTGGFGISGDMRNDGLFTSSLNRNLSFCGNMEIGQHYTNTLNDQRLYGYGLFRADVTAPIPISQADNQITMLRVDNTFNGLNLELPLGVKNTLRIRSGRINNSTAALLTLGDSTNTGILSTDPSNAQWWAEDPFTGTMATWDGGFVNGPFRRWFDDVTTGQEAIMPLADSITRRLVEVVFDSTNAGYLTAQFIKQQPGIAGLPVQDEQGIDIGFISPDGYWSVSSDSTSGLYDIAVNAALFTYDGVDPISSLSDIRLIKRPTGGDWQPSGSTNLLGPSSLSYLKSTGLTGFSDFGVGMGCGNIVSTDADSGSGSLRYVLANCISSGDTVKFDSSLSLLLITSDTIQLDKNVTIYASDQDNITIQGDGVHSILKVQIGVIAKIQNLELVTGSGTDGRAILNRGSLNLHDIQIHDGGTGGSTVLNRGELIVIGQTGIHNE